MYLSICHSQEETTCSETQYVSETYKVQITEQAAFYKSDKRELKVFEKRVNAASAELCLKDLSLLKRRGELLELSRKKVADDGYVFKKGLSRSKAYGESDTLSTPKRPKFDKEAREERITALSEELKDTARLLAYKEKSISQAESARNYKLCEKITEDLMALKSRRRELQAENSLFERKGKRARRREIRMRIDSESSDMETGPVSSRSTTPVSAEFHVRQHSLTTSLSPTSEDSEQITSQLSPYPSRSRSTTPARSVTPLSCDHEHSIAPSLLPTNAQKSAQVRALPQPLSPTSYGSRMNPIDCALPTDESIPRSPVLPQTNPPEYDSSPDNITGSSF